MSSVDSVALTHLMIGIPILVLAFLFIFYGIPMLVFKKMEDTERDVFDGKTLEQFLASKRKEKDHGKVPHA